MKAKEASIIGISIILGCVLLALVLKAPMNSLSEEVKNLSNHMELESNRYQIFSANDSNMILLDTKTGDYWRKYIEPNSGPTDWTFEAGPDLEE